MLIDILIPIQSISLHMQTYKSNLYNSICLNFKILHYTISAIQNKKKT